MSEQESAAPAMPVIREQEKNWASPFQLVPNLARGIGWEWLPDHKGGPAFVRVNRTALGSLKVVERFPLTPEG